MEKELIVKKEEKSLRLDMFLLKKDVANTRSRIKNLIDDGLVSVNGKNQKSGYAVRENDKIVVTLNENKALSAEPEDIFLNICYENDNLLVINKPQGMVVHPAAGNYSGTLVNALCYKIKNLSTLNGNFRAGIVHRLDKDTSGLLLVAKNDMSHENLAKQIQTKVCKRYYMALLEGNLKDDDGYVETYIDRAVKDRKKMEVSRSGTGKLATTLYRVIKRFPGYCLVEFELKTGRTHQIRVHAKYLGHPVVGDRVYGFKNHPQLKGQLLHAYKISFFEPVTKENITVECKMPEHFETFLKKIS